jgi:hypothetical protein
MAKKVYKSLQLPSSIDKTRMEWSGDDWNIWIERLENGKVKLHGELLEWQEDGNGDGDWEGIPMCRDEILDIADRLELVIPGNENRKLSDVFKRKSTAGK